MSAELLSDEGDELLVRFQVDDTGIGIEADKIGLLFTEFEQTDSVHHPPPRWHRPGAGHHTAPVAPDGRRGGRAQRARPQAAPSGSRPGCAAAKA
jgi:hypothetical protein